MRTKNKTAHSHANLWAYFCRIIVRSRLCLKISSVKRKYDVVMVIWVDIVTKLVQFDSRLLLVRWYIYKIINTKVSHGVWLRCQRKTFLISYSNSDSRSISKESLSQAHVFPEITYCFRFCLWSLRKICYSQTENRFIILWNYYLDIIQRKHQHVPKL